MSIGVARITALGGGSSGSSGAQNSFTTIQTDAGTSPVADSPTDTLTLTGTDILITGNATTDTVTFQMNPLASTTSKSTFRFPSGVAPTSPVEGDTWNDSTQKALITFVDGVKQTQATYIFTQTANGLLATNTNVATTILGTGVGTLTFPANFFVAGKTLAWRVYGTISSSITSFNFHLNTLLGTTSIVGSQTTSPSINLTNNSFYLEGFVTFRSAGVNGVLNGASQLSTNDPTGSGSPIINSINSTNIDTTIPLTFDIQVEMDTASTSNNWTTQVFMLEVCN